MADSPADGMSAPHRTIPSAPRAAGAVTAIASTVAYAWFASSTTPFTLAADVTTAVPLVAIVGVYLLQRWRPTAPWRRLPADQPPPGGTAVPWIAVVLLLAVSEVGSFFGPRATHPTLSSLTDTIFQWHAAKAAVFFIWSVLSWYFVRR